MMLWFSSGFLVGYVVYASHLLPGQFDSLALNQYLSHFRDLLKMSWYAKVRQIS